jgi:protein TonB
MDYAQSQRNPAKHVAGIVFVVVFHVVLIYGLMNGLARKVVEVIKGPLETRLIEEAKKAPPPETPPPPPPKLAPPPPPFIPPPEINVAVQQQSAGAITAIARTPPPAPVAAPVAAPPPAPKAPPVRTQPVIDAKRSCAEPEYPSASRRLEEEGTVLLRFLIDVDGKVVQSEVQSTSGYPRLDEAARQALSRCQFKPGTLDGKPEQSWASMKYTWKLQ